MRVETLTGRQRYRVYKPWFGKPLLVLQVEERIKGATVVLYRKTKEYDFTQWRDAQVEDYVTMEPGDKK